MNNIQTTLLLFVNLAVICCNPVSQNLYHAPRVVEIRVHENQYGIYRFGKPYYIKGACVQDSRYLRTLWERGGNSVRLFDTQNAQEVLDSAQALGLTVTIGLPLAPAGPQLDYSDEKAVDEQFQRMKQEVIRFKDHPALLMWSVGNEVGLKLSVQNFLTERLLWLHIDKIGRMIHELDPDHPVTCAIEGAGKLLYVRAFCNNIDVISINSYRSFNTVKDKIKQFGWDKAYIISEYGPTGYWFRERTDWYTFTEQTSSEKLRFMLSQYGGLRSDSNKCLGSYAFYWGHKNECTPTYFSLFTEAGEPTELVDGLEYCWTGRWPAKRTLPIFSISVNNQQYTQSIYLQSKKKYTARLVSASQPDKAVLRWSIEKDDGELYFDPTMNQAKREVVLAGVLSLPKGMPARFSGREKGNISHQFAFETPAETGPYRMFMFLKNEQGVATANACFYVFD